MIYLFRWIFLIIKKWHRCKTNKNKKSKEHLLTWIEYDIYKYVYDHCKQILCKRVNHCGIAVSLQTQHTHYDPRSGFLYHDMTHPPMRGHLLSIKWDVLNRFVGWILGTKKRTKDDGLLAHKSYKWDVSRKCILFYTWHPSL